MQNEICKNQNPQIPSVEGGVAKITNQFHFTLSNFFEFDDEKGHIKFLTEICRAFTGVSFNLDRTTLDIANAVFAVNEIKDFIRDIEDAYLSNEPGITIKEGNLIGRFLDPTGSRTAISVLNFAIGQWIHPDDTVYEIGYLTESLIVFRNIADLIKACNKINNHYQFTMEGGAKC